MAMDSDQARARRQRRTEFLRVLYEDVNASVNEFVDGIAIGSKVGADAEETRRIIAYFEEKGALMVDDHKTGVIRITATGIDLVEAEIL
jgi:predicted transcriptional regulator